MNTAGPTASRMDVNDVVISSSRPPRRRSYRDDGAVGGRMTELPITPRKIPRALAEKRAAEEEASSEQGGSPPLNA